VPSIPGRRLMAANLREEFEVGAKTPSLSGIIVLNKPSGPTSRELVDLIARLTPKTKVGHAGTLDPLASGILIVCLGAATRLTDLIQHLSKSYRALVRLGARSDTHDALGSIVATDEPKVPCLREIDDSLNQLRGNVMQQPPEHSALKIKGKRAYDLARAGKAVKLASRPVQIDRIEVLDYAWPNVELGIDCMKGVYIRSIARDLGDLLGCGGYVQELARTRIGPFTLEQAVRPTDISADSLMRLLRPPLAAVAHLNRVTIDQAQTEAVIHGRTIALPESAGGGKPVGVVALVDSESRLVALAAPDLERMLLQPRIVLIS
jgi:tRNA pseudouridine55 synthase